MGITEADGAYDVEGWDSAAKTAALANVLMDARITPQQVSTRGIARLTPERVQEIARQGKTVRLISRAQAHAAAASRCACAPRCWTAATYWPARRARRICILFHTDLMGTFGTVSIDPQVEQTAYGVFSDLVDLLPG